MKIACILVLALTYEYANAYVVERLAMPTVVLDSGCGCSPPIDYGCMNLMSLCGCGCSPPIDCGCMNLMSPCGCGCSPPIDYGCMNLISSCGCGCSPPIDYGYMNLMSPCGCGSMYDYDMPFIGYDTSICQRSFSPILDMGVAYPLMKSGIYEIPYPRPGCGCGCGCELVFSDCVPIPPLPPVIGCPKYLRQITIPPPFL